MRTIFEKGYTRNIPVKLFQNLTSGFGGEDFLRISSCPYIARSPYSPESCLWMHQNFANNFWKKLHKEHSCDIISKSDLPFRRRRFFKNFFMSILCKKPPFTRAMFMDGSKFREQFLNKSGKLSQDTPVLPQVVKLDKIQVWKTAKGNNSKIKQARLMIPVHCTSPLWDLSTHEIS